MTGGALTAAEAGLVSCEACHLLSRPASVEAPGYCQRCGEKLEFRRHGSIQITWALIVAATVCYFPAMALPVLNTTQLGVSEPDTILSGVAFLYTSGSWPLALVVLVASVMIPLGKLVALVYLLLAVQRGWEETTTTARAYTAWWNSSDDGRCSTCSSTRSPWLLSNSTRWCRSLPVPACCFSPQWSC